ITSPLAPTKSTMLFAWNGLIGSRNDSQQKNCQGIGEFFRPRWRRGKSATAGFENGVAQSWPYRVRLVPPTQISLSILNIGISNAFALRRRLITTSIRACSAADEACLAIDSRRF